MDSGKKDKELFSDLRQYFKNGGVSMRKEHKDPRGGLTSKGRSYYNRKTGSNLKPGVKGKADSPQKKRRKGSFLTRFYCKSPQPPFRDEDGDLTRHSKAARAWGEEAPSSVESAERLCQKGRRMLESYRRSKKTK